MIFCIGLDTSINYYLLFAVGYGVLRASTVVGPL